MIQLASAIEPYSIWFIEEPAVPGNIEVFKRLKEQIRIPLGSGERDRTIWEFLPYLQEGCLDVFVTRSGSESEGVEGWVTNKRIMRRAKAAG